MNPPLFNNTTAHHYYNSGSKVPLLSPSICSDLMRSYPHRSMQIFSSRTLHNIFFIKLIPRVASKLCYSAANAMCTACTEREKGLKLNIYWNMDVTRQIDIAVTLSLSGVVGGWSWGRAGIWRDLFEKWKVLQISLKMIAWIIHVSLWAWCASSSSSTSFISFWPPHVLFIPFYKRALGHLTLLFFYLFVCSFSEEILITSSKGDFCVRWRDVNIAQLFWFSVLSGWQTNFFANLCTFRFSTAEGQDLVKGKLA